VCGGSACSPAEIKAFRQELERLGWSEGKNIQIDRYVPAGAEVNALAKELVALQPDVAKAAYQGARLRG
jgi:hypothetical protein